MTRARLLFLVPFLGVLACDDGAETQEDDFTQAGKLVLLEGPELVSCRVEKGPEADPFFRADSVLCKLAPKTSFPLQAASVLVAVSSKKGSAGSADITSEEEAVVAKVFGDSYPIELEIHANYSVSDAGDLVGLGSGFFQSFESNHVVVAPSSDVVTARFPFDLWPVEVRASKASFQGSLDAFKLDLAPMATSSGAQTLDVKASLGNLSVGQTKRSLVPVTRGTERLRGEATIDGKKLPFELSGPGAYIAEPAGLRGATEADLTDVSGGPSFATCWAEPAATSGSDVFCQRGTVGGIAISKLDVLVGEDLDAATLGGEVSAAEPVQVASAASLPLTLWVRATLEGSEVVGLPSWQLETPLAVPVALEATATAEAPQPVRLPFDVWPISVNAAEGSFVCDLAPYTVPLGVAWGGSSIVKVEGAATPFINQGDQQDFFVVADSRAASLSCTGLIVTDSGGVTENLAITLVRGGSYEVGEKSVTASP